MMMPKHFVKFTRRGKMESADRTMWLHIDEIVGLITGTDGTDNGLVTKDDNILAFTDKLDDMIERIGKAHDHWFDVLKA